MLKYRFWGYRGCRKLPAAPGGMSEQGSAASGQQLGAKLEALEVLDVELELPGQAQGVGLRRADGLHEEPRQLAVLRHRGQRAPPK